MKLSPFAAFLCLLVPAAAADLDMSRMLKDIEAHYNSAKTLEVGFQETLVQQGRRRVESGILFLRKPGRMRWQYTAPAGKLLVSDGKTLYFFSPDSNRAEKMKLKETEDMRAPMAFLLGRLEFEKDFQAFSSKLDMKTGRTSITATPKSDKMPYREVTFLVAEGSRIDRLVVVGQDATVLEFDFSSEKVNPKLADSLFQFKLPPGAEYIDNSGDSKP